MRCICIFGITSKRIVKLNIFMICSIIINCYIPICTRMSICCHIIIRVNCYSIIIIVAIRTHDAFTTYALRTIWIIWINRSKRIVRVIWIATYAWWFLISYRYSKATSRIVATHIINGICYSCCSN